MVRNRSWPAVSHCTDPSVSKPLFHNARARYCAAYNLKLHGLPVNVHSSESLRERVRNMLSHKVPHACQAVNVQSRRQSC